MARKKNKSAAAEPAASEPTAPATPKALGRGTWKALDSSSTFIAAMVAPKATQLIWQIATGRKPPKDSKNPEVGPLEAIAWAAVAGAGVQVIRTVIQRMAANYWVKSTGDLPPGMKKK